MTIKVELFQGDNSCMLLCGEKAYLSNVLIKAYDNTNGKFSKILLALSSIVPSCQMKYWLGRRKTVSGTLYCGLDCVHYILSIFEEDAHEEVSAL